MTGKFYFAILLFIFNKELYVGGNVKAKNVFVSILMIIMLISIGCKSVYMRTGYLALRDEKDPDKALENFKKELELHPDNAEAYMFIAKIYGQKDDYTKAYENAQQAEKYGWDKKEIDMLYKTIWAKSHNKGITEYNAENYDKALEHFDLAITIFPDSVKSEKMKAATLVKLNKEKDAMAIYTKIAEKYPNDTSSRIQLGNYYAKEKDYQNAVKYYKQAVDIEPENSTILYNLAISYSNLKQTDNAIEFYKKALEYEPDNTDILFNIAALYFEKKTDTGYQEAIEFYRRILNLKPQNLKAIKYLCFCYVNIRDYENLAKYAKKWIELEPDNIEPYDYVIPALYKIGNEAEAKEYFDRKNKLGEQK
ncbi:MAG: hypothetical protein DRH57_00475 [Candidatus Cloacimonadota bacterium]|nr:MAG: hypothetical protein DRH57_00475 [Candidatus Cloacimonadota bacterium]